MTAISALLALYTTNRNEGPTVFLLNLDEGKMLRSISKLKGLGFRVSGGGGLTSNGRGGSREVCYFVHSPASEEFLSQVMPAFLQDIEALIVNSGCTIISQGLNRNVQSLHIQGFSVSYSKGRTKGLYRVTAIKQPDGEIRLYLLADEY